MTADHHTLKGRVSHLISVTFKKIMLITKFAVINTKTCHIKLKYEDLFTFMS